MGIQITRTGTNWTVDVTALQLVNDTNEKDFLVVIAKAEQPLTAYVKTSATVLTYTGASLPTNTVIDLYRWGLRDVDQLEYGEVTSQAGMNKRLTQIERVLDDLREVKQFIWSGIDGSVSVASHVALADPHNQYRLKSASIPASEVSGTLNDAQIPSVIARDTEVAAAITAHEIATDPHPTYTTAAELLTVLTGYLPTTQKGAINGIAPLDGTSKIPAINSRGCTASYASATGLWTFTWADGSTQTVDTPLELVFQSVNYNTATKQVTFTLVGGATTSFSLADLVDLPEIQVAVANPSTPPTSGQRLYLRSDTGDKWVSNGAAWVGPYLSLTPSERAYIASLPSALSGLQPLDADLTAIAGLSSIGIIRRTGNGTANTMPVGNTGAALLSAGDAAAGRAAIVAEARSDNYTKNNYSIKTGGANTAERWMFIPVEYDIYNRIVIARGYNDDSAGYAALSAVIEVCTGAWGSSGLGAFARVQKINEYGWPGAFAGATNHLLREVRLLESSGSEVAYSGLWLKLMGDRTYKISGAAGLPIEYATYVPTVGSPLTIVTPPGMGTQTRINGNIYFASNGEEIDPVIKSPNGSRWRVNVSNTGTLSTTAL